MQDLFLAKQTVRLGFTTVSSERRSVLDNLCVSIEVALKSIGHSIFISEVSRVKSKPLHKIL